MKKSVYTTGSNAGLIPVAIDVIECDKDLEIQICSGSNPFRLRVPSHYIAEIGAAFESIGSGNDSVSWPGQGIVSQKLWVKGKPGSDVVRCHLFVLLTIIPVGWTTFKCERHKLVSLGKALTSYAQGV